jgi:FkbM family methyltransferase
MNPSLIYDVGGHVGEDTDFYLKKGFKVVTIEANPVLAERLRERFWSNLCDGSLVMVETAIAEKAGVLDFYVNESLSIWGTIRPAWADRNARGGDPSRLIKVRATSFSEVLSKYGVPYYLKVDIEGADLLCLEALIDRADRPEFVSIESEKRSWQALLYEFEMFKRLGYSRFKIVDQQRVDRQEPPNPSAEGRYVEHRFDRGSSGLFGEELPGKWLTPRQAIRRYRFIFLRYRLFGEFGIHRILWKVPGLRKTLAPASNADGSKPGNRKRWFSAAIRQMRAKLKPSWYDTHATI